jgi:signal transduction histidine kinase
VTASRFDERLRIEVADDGSGITVPLGDDGLPTNAHGLRGIADRMRAAGGTTALASTRHGVTVTVEVPV